jgi:putative isomerase
MSFLDEDSELLNLRQSLFEINNLMQKGICIEPGSRRKFYTGYQDKILFDWDQFFEAIIQLYMGWDGEYIKNGILLFLDSQSESGFITRSIPVLPPNENEHAKPFLAQTIILLYSVFNEIDWLSEKYYQKLLKYIHYWIEDMDSNKNGLSEWMSSLHTGMDNQHERAGYWNEKFCEGVDLNCYLHLEFLAFSKLSKILNKDTDSNYFFQKAQNIKKLIIENMWDEIDGFFYDVDMRTNEKIKVKSISSFTPLWAKIATKGQAKRLIFEHLFNSSEFWSAFPIAALSRTEKGYSEYHLPKDIGCNWRASTWISTNYMIYHGLRQYGYKDLAALVSFNTIKVVEKSGSCEYYNSETGEGKKQKPFWGWSLLSYFLNYEENSKNNLIEKMYSLLF